MQVALAEGDVERETVLRVMRNYFHGDLDEDSSLGEIGVYRKNTINLDRQLKGGWESWLQCELANVLDTVCGYDVRREEQIYAGQQLVGFWGEPSHLKDPSLVQRRAQFRLEGGLQPELCLALELECQYTDHHQLDKFVQDVKKCMGVIWLQKIAPRGTKVLCVLVTTQQPNEKKLLDMIKSEWPSELTDRATIYTFYYKRIISYLHDDEWDKRGYYKHEGPMDLWLIWWQT